VIDDAVELAAAIRARRVSCVEVMSETLDRVERFNPKVNAIVALRERDSLLAEARERDAELARGGWRGPLHGFPQAIKDLEPVAGMKTSMGFPPLRDFVPAADSIMVERMRGAGAIFIGRTNTPEFGLGSHTYNRLHGVTRNAYDQTRTAGGSSGGAAVALALRMLPVADGSDYGGSLRNPAGWNNVFSLRPSIGRVPSTTRDAWLPSMGVLGPMARSVPDLALLFGVQAGYDARAPLSSHRDPARFIQPLERNFKGARVAWLGDFGGYLQFEPGVQELCESSLKIFEQLGCVVEKATPDYPIERVWRAWLKIRASQVGVGLKEFYDDPAKRKLLKPEVCFEIESGQKLGVYDLVEADVVRGGWYRAVLRFFETFDYFVVPSAQVFPFDVSTHWPAEINGIAMDTYHRWMEVAIPVTMSGCPSLNVPVGFNSAGLPMGVQIVAPIHAEFECLQLAYAYDQATGWVGKRLPSLLTEA
jgi:amidase